MQRNNGTWMAFLAMTFVVVGLTGLFASYAAPLPLERALARDAALDEALASGGQHDLLDKLRPQLDDSAAAVIDGAGPLEVRVAAARASMHTELLREADSVGTRLRLMIMVVTVVAAIFGAIILGAASRTP